VEIKDIAREPGDRAKVSVFSRNKDVDATGSCIGRSGARIQQISNQLLGEKIDVINYYKDPVLYIAEALKPANVIGVNLIDSKSAIAVVDDEDFSLAIGKKGINARLAVKLTGTKIDIKSLSAAVSEGIEYTSVEATRNAYEYELKHPMVEEKVVETIEETPVVETKVEETKVEVTPEVKVEVKPAVKIVKTEAKKVETTSTFTKPKKEEKKTFKAKKEDKDVKRTTINSQELQDIKKQNEAARNYMPVYTDEELESLDDDYEDVDDFYDNIDYDDYDEYYDED